MAANYHRELMIHALAIFQDTCLTNNQLNGDPRQGIGLRPVQHTSDQWGVWEHTGDMGVSYRLCENTWEGESVTPYGMACWARPRLNMTKCFQMIGVDMSRLLVQLRLHFNHLILTA
jgi:hypothetical protein